MRYLILLCIQFLFVINVSAESISFHADKRLLTNSIVQTAINDFKSLIEKYTSSEFTVSNNNNAEVWISLIPTTSLFNDTSSINNKTTGIFEWKSNSNSSAINLELHANSTKAFADGLYALLQEVAGFSFYHPRELLTPKSNRINWKQIPSLTGHQIFETSGFHLHTMHPIELTENLLDETSPNALENVKEYIDWLARNGQNYFEFYLLESINRKTWIQHAKAITDYAHSRGIQCGVELSLHMIQQKAFKLYNGKLNKPDKIKKNIAWLAPAGFDVWNVEISTHEFSQGNAAEKKILLKLLAEELDKLGIKLMSRAHVVQPKKMVSGNKEAEHESLFSDKHGVMIHTVMFYTLNDVVAPVYENENLLHMKSMLEAEQHKRETWYYPESAYWVTFDNSVPMLLLPYLSARLEDINYCMKQQVTGHVTFSSGWEWGYWLIDWSIARWSWNYAIDNKLIEKPPLQFLNDITTNSLFLDFVQKNEFLQQKKIKEQELIRVLTAQTVTDEIKGKFNTAYHPRPEMSYKYIRNKASLKDLEFINTKYILSLVDFVLKAENDTLPEQELKKLSAPEKEIYDALMVTFYRAKHRLNTLSYLVEYRQSKLSKIKTDSNAYLDDAKTIRLNALSFVQNREQSYRYPMESIALKRKDHTAYHFGYLYPVHQLHFWEREELQAKKNKYNFLFKNIWNIARIIGLIN